EETKEIANDDFINEMLFYGEKELTGIQEDMTSASTSQNENTEISTIQLVNLRKEVSKKKHGQYTCGFCKEAGHNIVT
ncbi:20166_t:CDS:2, partial [Cetraspora pellucida]